MSVCAYVCGCKHYLINAFNNVYMHMDGDTHTHTHTYTHTHTHVCVSMQKPIWLEMMNKDENALMAPPVRLILKMRDDLRQDMITLKMFSLFEKVSCEGCGLMV